MHIFVYTHQQRSHSVCNTSAAAIQVIATGQSREVATTGFDCCCCVVFSDPSRCKSEVRFRSYSPAIRLTPTQLCKRANWDSLCKFIAVLFVFISCYCACCAGSRIGLYQALDADCAEDFLWFCIRFTVFD